MVRDKKQVREDKIYMNTQKWKLLPTQGVRTILEEVVFKKAWWVDGEIHFPPNSSSALNQTFSMHSYTMLISTVFSIIPTYYCYLSKSKSNCF